MRKIPRSDASKPRLRLKRTRVVNIHGARFDVYVGRGTKWGNPFHIGPNATRRKVVQKYEAWIAKRPELLAALGEIRGKVIGCHCTPLACHGDVLARLADAPATEG